jgi:hypothetical protein
MIMETVTRRGGAEEERVSEITAVRHLSAGRPRALSLIQPGA